MNEPSENRLDRLCVDTIRTLAMDAVQQANSGHPGTAMALAPVVYVLWQRFLRFDPQDPLWPDRDRFVLSIGHASMLLYSMLHLTGVKAVNPQYERLGEAAVNIEDIQYDFNLADIAELWRRGSVVSSWLLDLAAIALARQPDLSNFSGRVSDSGEGRWTLNAAIEEGTPVPVLSAALYQRFNSRGEDEFAAKLLSAMRYEFGGHVERAAGG